MWIQKFENHYWDQCWFWFQDLDYSSASCSRVNGFPTILWKSLIIGPLHSLFQKILITYLVPAGGLQIICTIVKEFSSFLRGIMPVQCFRFLKGVILVFAIWHVWSTRKKNPSILQEICVLINDYFWGLLNFLHHIFFIIF